MSTKIARKELILVIAVVGLLLAALAMRSSNATLAQKAQKPTLKDAVTKKSASSIEANPGFVLVQKGESEFTVMSNDREIVGSISCGSCGSEGRCRTRLIKRLGTCAGCNGGRDCSVNPF